MIERQKSSPRGDLQLGNILVDGPVHELKVNAQVVVHKDIPKPCQPLPVDRRLRCPHGFTEMLARFGQRLQIPDHAILNQMRGKETLTAAGRVLFDAGNTTQDVL